MVFLYIKKHIESKIENVFYKRFDSKFCKIA